MIEMDDLRHAPTKRKKDRIALSRTFRVLIWLFRPVSRWSRKAMIRSYVAAWIAAFALSANAESPSDFAFRIPLVTDGEAAFFRVELPPPVYEGAVRRDLGDLRIFNGDGSLTILDSVIEGNTEGGFGGAISNNGELIIADTSITGNSSGGGAIEHRLGTATLTNVTMSGNVAKSAGS